MEKKFSKEVIEKISKNRKGKNIGKKHPLWKGGVAKNNIAIYDTYAPQISFAEKVRRNLENSSLLEVTCSYCGRWYSPSAYSVYNRRNALLGKFNDYTERRFYCSDYCRHACPVWNQRTYPKGFKKATSREVQPELRQLVLKRDEYACQLCDNTIENTELHCHHITAVAQNPIESADIDNCITLCKKCHKKVHSKKGCRYFELKCKGLTSIN
jgi:5-methylcytosine-specific restriction endonuclease McrA